MSDDDDAKGKISLITGPMFAGKSTELCARRSRSNSIKAIIIAPILSKDHSAGAICPREQTRQHQAVFVDTLTIDYAQCLITEAYGHVFIDEAQFFNNADELTTFCRTLVDNGIHVTIAALNLDCKKQPWPAIALLESSMSPKTNVLYARCSFPCKQPAIYTAKVLSSSQVIDTVIDVLAEYKPLCEDCYLKI